MAVASKRLFIGQRLRRLRRELGLTQVQMAADLDVSASYVTLIERNQRPLPVDLLLRLAETYGLDLSAFSSGDDETLSVLNSALTDPIFQELSIGREDVRDLLSGNSAMGEAVATLYQAYRASQASLLESRAAGTSSATDSFLEVQEFISNARNYFPALDEFGETIAKGLEADGERISIGLARRFEERHKLQTRVLPAKVMAGALRRHDQHRRQIAVSEALDPASQTFQFALQLVFMEENGLLEEALKPARFETDAARRMTRAALANYTAAAIVFPYERFYQSTIELRYDIEALARRFGASFEQVAHRVTTLQRPGLEGVPFFFLRIDPAGNVAKRFSSGALPFVQYGGSCPLWSIHETFRTPRKILTQIIQLPEGDKYFSIARASYTGEGGYAVQKAHIAVGLGCEINHASRLIYADGVDVETAPATPIGVTCRLCPRPHCAARAHPPLERRLTIDDHRRMATPFSFAFD